MENIFLNLQTRQLFLSEERLLFRAESKSRRAKIIMKAKPAKLRVQSTIDGKFENAEILIRDKSSNKIKLLGKSLTSIQRALPVFLGLKDNKIQGTQRFEILVKSANGYSWKGNVLLIAGREKTIFAQLTSPE